MVTADSPIKYPLPQVLNHAPQNSVLHETYNVQYLCYHHQGVGELSSKKSGYNEISFAISHSSILQKRTTSVVLFKKQAMKTSNSSIVHIFTDYMA